MPGWKSVLFGTRRLDEVNNADGHVNNDRYNGAQGYIPSLPSKNGVPLQNSRPTNSLPSHQKPRADQQGHSHEESRRGYGLAAHARASLQLDDSTRYQHHASSASTAFRGSQQPVAWPAGPSYSPDRIPSPPKGPRPQYEYRPRREEGVPDLADLWSTPSASRSGGFAHPSLGWSGDGSGPHAHSRQNTGGSPTRLYAEHTGGCYSVHTSPTRHNGGNGYTTQIRNSNYGYTSQVPPQPRLHTHSTPPRLHVQNLTPPTLMPRPHSSPAQSPVNVVPDPKYRRSPQKSPAHHHASRASSPAAGPRGIPNQCHGTTGTGKRCTRIVKGKKGSSRTDGPGCRIGSSSLSKSPHKGAETGKKPMPAPSLTSSALRELDRRLSIGRHHRRSRPAPSGKPKKSKGGGIVIDITDSSDEDVSDEETDRLYRRSRKGRIDTVHEEDEEGDTEGMFEELPVYCFQHVKQTLEQKGTYIGSQYVEFSDWIRSELPQETRLQLMHEMSKPLSPDDERGYIYVHEMAGSDYKTSSTTFLKLGRSIHPVARLSQWKSQCKSRKPIVRDIFPLHPSHPSHPSLTASRLLSSSPSRLHGALLFAEQGAPHHHRWERLCLIELAGLSAMQAANRSEEEIKRKKCTDCGKIHVELFLMDRTAYVEQVFDMVLKWQRFVETVA